MYQSHGVCRERKSQNEREDHVTFHLVTLDISLSICPSLLAKASDFQKK